MQSVGTGLQSKLRGALLAKWRIRGERTEWVFVIVTLLGPSKSGPRFNNAQNVATGFATGLGAKFNGNEPVMKVGTGFSHY